MVGAVTEPHPLWETVHAPKIKFEEALEPEKLSWQSAYVFLSCTLWVGGFLSSGSEKFQQQN